ncbi:MAG: exonuclease domain-containing protein [Cytophagales bacterium]
MFAIIDIETTGSRPDVDKIIEIAIVIHDGLRVIETFDSLVNPETKIPYRISQLTGIDDLMVSDAPKFYEIARKIYDLTNECTFVAHNVRFDYSFVKSAFKDLGFIYNKPTLCTVALSKKAFPGQNSYSLGKLCDSLGIGITHRHRALGDAQATAEVFTLINQNLNFELQQHSDAQRISNQVLLPPLLNVDDYYNIPNQVTGVYTFYDHDGDLLYIGKSYNIKKRLSQHFSITNKQSRKSLELKSKIAHIDYINTGSELVALLLESHLIKEKKPPYNVSQKRTRLVPHYGIYKYVDTKGYLTFEVKRLVTGINALATFDSMQQAKQFLQNLVLKYNLCLSKADLHHTGGACFNYHIKKCKGACTEKESAEIYNAKVLDAVKSFSFEEDCFFLIDNGRYKNEKSVICVERGQYKGFGYISDEQMYDTVQTLRDCITYYPDNRDIQSILCSFANKKLKKIKYQLTSFQ